MNGPEADRQLLERTRSGDSSAFNLLVKRHSPDLYRIIHRMSSDSSETEAIVQETFLRVWQILRSPRSRAQDWTKPFFPYLVTIAINLARDRWRKDRFLDFSGLEDIQEVLPSPMPDPEAQVEETETLRALAEAVAELPTAYKAVIALRYEAGLSYAEIAEILELPINTVRTHLHRAKIRLREVLAERGSLNLGLPMDRD
jgi:RNA polymerase sigma-70 factor (ECF subfamily)